MKYRCLSRYGNWGSPLLIVLCVLLGASYAEAQQPVPTISVTVNKTLVFRLAEKAKRLSVTQPEIADVLVVAPNQILINGKSVGTTSLVVFDEKGNVTNYDLLVTSDLEALRRQLHAIFPDEKINISSSGPNIVLRGEVSNEVIYDKVLEIAQTYLPPRPSAEVAPPAPSQSVNISSTPKISTSGTGFAGGGSLAFEEQETLTDVERWGDKRRITGIVDLLVIKEVRQIELSVVVAEVSLSKLRELGVDFQFDILHGGNKVSAGISRLGSQAGLTGGSLIGDPTTFPPTTTLGGAANAAIALLTDRYNIASVFRLFQNKDITEILAQPKLVIKNGRSGGFLAGGEFPVTSQIVGVGSNTVDIEFKPFGVRLDFLPTLTWSNAIDLKVFPEVSEIDASVNVLGVPGLKVRRSVSRVEMREGETLIMSGLLDKRVLKDVTKFPVLGDIPILGALFRSTRFRNQESELVFVITPRIVRPFKVGEKVKLPALEKYDDPDIRQFPLPESRSGSSSSKKPAGQGATIP